MTFDFSLALNRWDVILVIVVSLQTAILAYAASPKAKSVMMTLPFPFTIVTLSLGLDVDATNVLALVILFVYSHSIRLLHDRVGVPIVMTIPTGLMISANHRNTRELPLRASHRG